MEKAMDAGEKVIFELLETYRDKIASQYVAVAGVGDELSELAEGLFYALKESYIVFEEMLPKKAEGEAKKFIHLVQWGFEE